MKKFIFSTIAFLLVMVILELSARITESALLPPSNGHEIKPGWQTQFFKSFLDWHESDPDLLWRFKSGLKNPLITTNSQHLLGNELPKHKGSNVYRILLLGDSSPIGLGLKSRHQAFGEIVNNLLNLEYHGNRKFELVNAAVSGYTSEQIACFLDQKGWSYQPDLVLLYCGNNDASISGPCHDREILQQQKFKGPRRLLSKTALYRLMKSIIVSTVDKSPTSCSGLKVRVTPEQYGENLKDIIQQCQNHNCPLIILKPAVPLLWPAGLQFRSLAHTQNEEGELIFPDEMRRLLGRPIRYCLSRVRFRSLYGEGDTFTRNVYNSAFTDSIAPDHAVAYYTDQLTSEPENPVTANNLGVAWWENGHYDSADVYLKLARILYMEKSIGGTDDGIIAAGSPFLYNIGINILTMSGDDSLTHDSTSGAYLYLDSALQADFFSLRIKKSYWAEIDAVNHIDDVFVIDLPRLFTRDKAEKLFIDHCHPTEEGHRLIASAILETIIDNQIIK